MDKLTAIACIIHDKMYAIMDNNFRDWLIKQLKEQNLSQSGLATRAGISRQSVSDYINDNRIPDKDASIKIARGLRIPVIHVLRAQNLIPPISPEAETAEVLAHRIMLLPKQIREFMIDSVDKATVNEREITSSEIEKPER